MSTARPIFAPALSLAILAVSLVMAPMAESAGSGGIGPGPAPPAETAPPPDAEPPDPKLRLVAASATPTQAFFDAEQSIRFVYELRGPGPVDLRFDIVDQAGTIKQTLYRSDAPTGSRASLSWDGLGADGLAATGQLRVEIRGAGGEAIQTSKHLRRNAPTEFMMRGFTFPLPARHSYGDGIGAGRNHGGQDLAARCSKSLIAARGGRVRDTGFEARGAGNYLVINTRASRLDLVYMHMEAPAPVSKGQRIHTGQLIGRVGSTGRSTGCHLHFEIWRGAWGVGGSRIDPTPLLMRWDRYS